MQLETSHLLSGTHFFFFFLQFYFLEFFFLFYSVIFRITELKFQRSFQWPSSIRTWTTHKSSQLHTLLRTLVVKGQPSPRAGMRGTSESKDGLCSLPGWVWPGRLQVSIYLPVSCDLAMTFSGVTNPS